MIKNELMKIRNKIQELARQFNLKYKDDLFKVSFIMKRELVILNYLTGCPAYPYIKFGKNTKERIKRVHEFLSSKDFKTQVKELGGCVTSKVVVNNVLKSLKDRRIKNLWKGIIKKLKLDNKITVITIPKDRDEKIFVFNTILFHEWIHFLLIYNKISFQKIKQKYWTLDEGLVTYLQTFYENKKSDISEIIKKQLKSKKATNLSKTYGKNALKWNKILENKNTSEKEKGRF